MATVFEYQEAQPEVLAYADSDWDGDRTSGKSTSSNKVFVGRHLVETAANTQQVVAMSSGEAEFYSMGAAAARALTLARCVDALREACGQEGTTRVRPLSDSAAARGMCQRRGVGRVRHMDSRFLWLQDEIREHRDAVGAVATLENPADVGTKHLPCER